MTANDYRPLGDTGRDRLLLFLGVAVVAFLAHVRTLDGPFILEAAGVPGGPPAPVMSPELHHQGAIPADMPRVKLWRPALDLRSRILSSLFFDEPRPWHLFSLLLNALNAVLLCALVNQLFRNRALAALVGILFAVHPIHTEAVASTAYGGELLALAFILSGLLLFVHWERGLVNGRWRAVSLGGALALGAAGMLTWQNVVALPLVLVFGAVPALLPRRRWAWAAAAPLLVLGVAYVAGQGAAAAGDVGGMSTTARLGLIGRSGVVAARLLVLPWPLSPWHVLPLASFWSGVAGVVLAAACLIGVVAAFRLTRGQRDLHFGVLWTLLALAPTVNIVWPNPARPVAEHALYAASAGWCIALGAILHLLLTTGPLRRRQAAGLATGAIVLVLMAVNAAYSPVWSSSTRFWQQVRRDAPEIMGPSPVAGNKPGSGRANEEVVPGGTGSRASP